MRPISPSQAIDFVARAITAKQVPYLAGPPGIGKSDVAKKVANDFNLFLVDVRLSQMLPEDMTGLPNLDIKKGKAVYTPFETFPMDGDKIPDGYDGWLILLDELSSASEEVLAASYSIILDHMVGGKKIHPRARIMAAGNRSCDSAIARELPDTIITRVLPVEIKAKVADWLDWAKNTATESNPHTMSFIKKYPDMLIDSSNADKRNELEPYPNPRAWGRAMVIMNLFQKIQKKKAPREDIPGVPVPGSQEEFMPSDPIDDVTFHLLEAAVGSIAASSYKEDYNESLSLPQPWECAQAPASVPIPSTGAGKSTLTNTLAKYYLASGEEARDGVLSYMNRVGGEYTSLFSQIIIDNLGQTASEIKLIRDVKTRLSVDDLDLGSFETLNTVADPMPSIITDGESKTKDTSNIWI